MVEINFEIRDVDEENMVVTGRASIYSPHSDDELNVGRFLVPLLGEVCFKLREQFPGKNIRIAEFDSPLDTKSNPPIDVDKPWRRGGLI